MSRRPVPFGEVIVATMLQALSFRFGKPILGYGTVHTYYHVPYGIMRRLIELWACVRWRARACRVAI
jgi:hypothetical protein